MTVEMPVQETETEWVSDGDNAPFSADVNNRIDDVFRREGYFLIRNVLPKEEVQDLRERIDRAYAHPQIRDKSNLYCDYVLCRLFELDRTFRDMLAREPIISLMESILGKSCHVIANTALRNRPGEALSNFHVDDFLWFPLPDSIPRFDSQMVMPCFQVNVQIALSDIHSIDQGPTEVVPRSHYSGRPPNDLSEPEFEGQKRHPILCNAGDVYLQHPQVWHRGAPNESSETRYVLQQHYSIRSISQRFYPFLNYHMGEDVIGGCDERTLRLLGKHNRGAYG